MTPTELYKAILASITQVRNVRMEAAANMLRSEDASRAMRPDNALLDEMARNAAQVVLGLIDEAKPQPGWGRAVGPHETKPESLSVDRPLAVPFTSSMVDTICERCKQPCLSGCHPLQELTE